MDIYSVFHITVITFISTFFESLLDIVIISSLSELQKDIDIDIVNRIIFSESFIIICFRKIENNLIMKIFNKNSPLCSTLGYMRLTTKFIITNLNYIPYYKDIPIGLDYT